ncbi:hypothetical protein P4E94_18975 [Pontiellaceae bacterium B12219]|nr:hypothetical protein [Pontiellaceae bacterium B12219]
MKKRTTSKILSLVILLIILIPCLWVGWIFCQFKWGWGLGNYHSFYYESLPETATDIKEATFDNFPDYALILKAKITPEEFNEYVNKLELGTITNSSWARQPVDPDWWNPTTNSSHIGSQPSVRGDFVVAKYEDGYIYLMCQTF